MRRYLLGIIAALLITTGGGLWLYVGQSDSTWSMMSSISLRVGVVLGAFWLAFPDLLSLKRRVPPMLLVGILLSLIAIVISPRSFFFIAPLVGVMLVLQFIRWLFAPPPKSTKKRAKQKPAQDADPAANSTSASQSDAHEPAKR